jgi:hypothetical protein
VCTVHSVFGRSAGHLNVFDRIACGVQLFRRVELVDAAVPPMRIAGCKRSSAKLGSRLQRGRGLSRYH